MKFMATEKCLYCHTIKEVPPVGDKSRRHIICPKCLELAGEEWLPQEIRYKTLEDFKRAWVYPFQKAQKGEKETE
jgi:hypothetical protein